MSSLSELIRAAQHQARSMSTECLVTVITEESQVLSGKVADLETAIIGRFCNGPDGEMRYADMFADVMATVLTLAAFTAELVNIRVETFEFPGDPRPADASLN